MRKPPSRIRLLPGVLLALTLLLSLSAAGCGPAQPTPAPAGTAALQPAPLAPGAKLRVVATTSIVGDVVGRVGGDRIALTTLMALGADPHTYVATPSDSAAVHDAHLLFSNGAGLEEGMSELSLDGGGAVHIRLSDGLPLLAASHEGGSERAAHGAGSELDPHVWLDVHNVIAWTETVRRVLSSLDPAGAGLYQANADAFRAELQALDEWIVAQVATLPREKRRLVTNHESLAYFAQRYGFEVVGAVFPISPASEPSARDLAALEEAIRVQGLQVLFTESTISPVLAEQVARDTGVRLVPLYTGSLGPPGSGAETYLHMLRFDVQAVVEALQ